MAVELRVELAQLVLDGSGRQRAQLVVARARGVAEEQPQAHAPGLAGQVPRAVRATAGEAGAVTGTTSSIWNPPAVQGEPTGTIESEITPTTEPSDELEQEWLKTQKRPESGLPDRLE